MLQCLLRQRIDTLSFGLSDYRQPFVQIRRNAQIEFSGIIAARLDFFFLADIEKDTQRNLELFA